LIVERHADRTYTEQEMDIGAEFAALATTAGDEAAEAMLVRHSREMDDETGLYNREKFDDVLKQAIDVANLQRKQLAFLRICFDNFSDLVANKPVLKKELLQSLVAALNDDVDYGVTLARFDGETIVVLMPDKNLGQAREQAQRICNMAISLTAASEPDLKVTLSVGVSHLQAGEKSSKSMFDRSATALVKAQQYGGNQIQAVSDA
ncbi:MAG: GGDEF domain-containing protein, partial [Arenimonas sp.]